MCGKLPLFENHHMILHCHHDWEGISGQEKMKSMMFCFCSWTHARSHWSNISVVTREQGPIRALISFAYKRNLITSINWECAEHKFWATSWHWLRLACWGWPVGFISTCVRSSKLSLRTRLLRLVKTPACTRQNYGGRQGVTHSFWQFFAHV